VLLDCVERGSIVEIAIEDDGVDALRIADVVERIRGESIRSETFPSHLSRQ
jgi:hypothetical protein